MLPKGREKIDFSSICEQFTKYGFAQASTSSSYHRPQMIVTFAEGHYEINMPTIHTGMSQSITHDVAICHRLSKVSSKDYQEL